MKFFETAAVVLAGASTALAAAAPARFGGYHGRPAGTATAATPTGAAPTGTPTAGPGCLTDDAANYLVNGYASLLTAYTNATAEALLASDFTDTSDSINWLAGIPLGGYTFASKAAFEAGQGTQPPIGFTVSETMHSCSEVAFRWVASVGLKKWPAKGINYFSATNLNNTAQGWQIQNMYSEFNVGAWETDIGRTCSPQGANQ